MKSKIKQARFLRKNQTTAEKIIWRRLRSRQLAGYKFRRQHNLGRFIVDFYCDEIKLIIEIDGDVHAYAEREKYDRQRQKSLESEGLEIIRYTNYEVYDNLDGVLEDILRKCEKLKKDRFKS